MTDLSSLNAKHTSVRNLIYHVWVGVVTGSSSPRDIISSRHWSIKITRQRRHTVCSPLALAYMSFSTYASDIPIEYKPLVRSCGSLALTDGADCPDHFHDGAEGDQAKTAGMNREGINPVDHMAKCR